MTNSMYDKYTCPACGITFKRILFLIDGECPACDTKYTGVSLDELVIERARADERAKVLDKIRNFCSEKYDNQIEKRTHDSASAYATVISFANQLEKDK